MLARTIAVACSLALATACTGGDSGAGSPTSVAAPTPQAATTTVSVPARPSPAEAPAPARLGVADEAVLNEIVRRAGPCDWLVGPTEPGAATCLLPFPSDWFTVADTATATGRRVSLASEAMPVNAGGVPVNPDAWNELDGFSPGATILVDTPVVDLAASRAPRQGDLARSLEDDSPVVLLDLTTGARVLHWVEMDTRPEVPDEQRDLLIHPAAQLEPGHRIAVVLRNLVDEGGGALRTPDPFRVLRDGLVSRIPAVEARRPAMDDLLAELGELGIPKDDLYLAWDFTVASDASLTSDALAMRDLAFATVGASGAPSFTVTEVDEGPDLPDGVARRVRGTFEVPSFLAPDPAGLSRLTRGPDGGPEPNGVFLADFSCSLTRRQLGLEGAVVPARPVVYGHGLLGSERESERGDLGLAAQDLMPCATKWVGMSEADVPTAVAALGEMSQFPTIPDQLRQGLVNTLFLARLMRSPGGFVSDPAFRGAEASIASIDTSEVFFEGHSQGGIMGVAATALSTEWTKAVLGVPGINYSLLLQRSTDWPAFSDVLAAAYPDPRTQNVLITLAQQLWDRGEGAGYARHLTDRPLPGTPVHQVVVHVAFGDHQVAQVAAEVLARTAGIPVRSPALDDGRHPDAVPFAGLELRPAAQPATSLLVYWDSGALGPLAANQPPTQGPEWEAACSDPAAPGCADPHEDPRRDPEAQRQRLEFFETGEVVDVCDAAPCRAAPTGS